jgi:hypothetical protein
MDSFKVYEDWSDAIVIFLFDGGEVRQAFEGWECGMKGGLLDAIGELAEDPDAWEGWMNDMMEVLTEKYVVDEYNAETGEIVRGHYEPYTIEGVYQTAKKDEKYTSLIAEGEFGKFTIYLENMGEAGRFVFGL